MKVSLEDVLEARDRRQEKRRELALKYRLPVVVLTLNIPGETKRGEIPDYIFEAGVEAIGRELLEETAEFSVARAADAAQLKKRMCRIEESHFLGRIFDIDVYDGEGGQVSRSSLNLAERKCLLCGNDARICARSRVHSADELNEKIAAMKEEYELLYD